MGARSSVGSQVCHSRDIHNLTTLDGSMQSAARPLACLVGVAGLHAAKAHLEAMKQASIEELTYG